MELNKIYNEDCIEGMKKLPDCSIDCIICDLPYGTTQCEWDKIIPFDQMWEQINRIIKQDTAIVLFGAEPFSSQLRLSNKKAYKYDWVWDKCLGTGFLNAKKQPLRVHECISVFYYKQPTYNPQFFYKGHKRKMKGMSLKPHSQNYGAQQDHICQIDDYMCYPLSIIQVPQIRGNGKEKVNHPTQKPVALIEYLVRTFSNENDTILDFCIGSGTTAVACTNLSRNYIGFESNSIYYQLACNRVKEALREPRLAI